MKTRIRNFALAGMALLAANNAHAAAFDGTATATQVSTFVSGGLSDLVGALVALSVGVFIVGLALKFARKSSK